MIGTVHCDSCGHDIKEQDVEMWHNKACPVCGKSPLISDDDLTVARVCDELIAAGLATQSPSARGGIGMRINTAGLRKSK